LDPDAYMFRAPETFFQDVNAVYDQKWGKVNQKPAPKQPDTEEDAFNDYTRGIFGGQESGGRPQPSKPQEELGSITGDIREWQKKAGVY
jgi:hypothetical protein